jgi:hypothetical protein
MRGTETALRPLSSSRPAWPQNARRVGALVAAQRFSQVPRPAATTGRAGRLRPSRARLQTRPHSRGVSRRRRARYEFQLAADVGFNAPVLGKGEDQFFTRNSRATLKKTVPNGTYYWRVRAVSADGSVSPWSAPRQLRKGWTLAPALQAPAHGAVVSHPTNPLVLRWSAVPHASKYLVTIASDPQLGSRSAVSRTIGPQGPCTRPRALASAGRTTGP